MPPWRKGLNKRDLFCGTHPCNHIDVDCIADLWGSQTATMNGFAEFSFNHGVKNFPSFCISLNAKQKCKKKKMKCFR